MFCGAQLAPVCSGRSEQVRCLVRGLVTQFESGPESARYGRQRVAIPTERIALSGPSCAHFHPFRVPSISPSTLYARTASVRGLLPAETTFRLVSLRVAFPKTGIFLNSAPVCRSRLHS